MAERTVATDRFDGLKSEFRLRRGMGVLGSPTARCGLVEGPLGAPRTVRRLPPNAVYARAIEAFDPTTEEAMRCVSRLLYWRHAAEHPSPGGFDHSVPNLRQRGATVAEPPPGLDFGENETVETLWLTANASPVYLWATPTQWAAASHARDVFYAGRAAQGSQTLAGLPPPWPSFALSEPSC